MLELEFWTFQNIAKVAKLNTKQANLFAKNIMTILIQDVNNTVAGNQKEIIPSSWSPIIVKYSVYNINSEEKEALGRLVVKSSQSESESKFKSKSGIQCPNQCFW